MTPAGYKRSIYLPRELWARLEQAADDDERTVSQWISIQLRELLDQRDRDALARTGRRAPSFDEKGTRDQETDLRGHTKDVLAQAKNILDRRDKKGSA